LNLSRLEGLHQQCAEADMFSRAVVQDFDGVTVENGDDGDGEVGTNTSRH